MNAIKLLFNSMIILLLSPLFVLAVDIGQPSLPFSYEGYTYTDAFCYGVPGYGTGAGYHYCNFYNQYTLLNDRVYVQWFGGSWQQSYVFPAPGIDYSDRANGVAFSCDDGFSSCTAHDMGQNVAFHGWDNNSYNPPYVNGLGPYVSDIKTTQDIYIYNNSTEHGGSGNGPQAYTNEIFFRANIQSSRPVTSPQMIPFLSFPLAGYTPPLAGYTPYTAPVSSVFDHSGNARYDNNAVVVAFTGEKGTLGPYSGSTCYSKADGSEFGSGFNYVGDSKSGRKNYLCYDGHPGIDYPVPANTPIYAAANGDVDIPEYFPGIPNAKDYNTIAIVHKDGYKTYYMHLKSQNVTQGQKVIGGKTIIGHSGDVGSTGSFHLHFEVQKNGIPVDPYGWQGAQLDPYLRATNEELWIPPPISVGANSAFTSVQGAYDSVTKNGQSLLLQEQAFPEYLVFSKNLIVKLQGGYDPNYQTKSGWTIINGSLTINSGSVEVDGICIQK